jgi:hypothetical protein
MTQTQQHSPIHFWMDGRWDTAAPTFGQVESKRTKLFKVAERKVHTSDKDYLDWDARHGLTARLGGSVNL